MPPTLHHEVTHGWPPAGYHIALHIITARRLAMVTAYPTVEDLTMNSRGAYACYEAEKRTLLLPVSRLETKVIFQFPSPTWKPCTSTRHLPMAGDESGTLQEAIAQATYLISSAQQSKEDTKRQRSFISSVQLLCCVDSECLLATWNVSVPVVLLVAAAVPLSMPRGTIWNFC